MYPKSSGFLEEACFDSTKDAHGYIFLDLKQETPNELRIQTNVFSLNKRFVYVCKKEF